MRVIKQAARHFRSWTSGELSAFCSGNSRLLRWWHCRSPLSEDESSIFFRRTGTFWPLSKIDVFRSYARVVDYHRAFNASGYFSPFANSIAMTTILQTYRTRANLVTAAASVISRVRIVAFAVRCLWRKLERSLFRVQGVLNQV